MARRKTPFLPNNYHHIYNGGASRADIFLNEVINLFDKYPDGIPILIIISAILASVLLWFDQ